MIYHHYYRLLMDSAGRVKKSFHSFISVFKSRLFGNASTPSSAPIKHKARIAAEAKGRLQTPPSEPFAFKSGLHFRLIPIIFIKGAADLTRKERINIKLKSETSAPRSAPVGTNRTYRINSRAAAASSGSAPINSGFLPVHIKTDGNANIGDASQIKGTGEIGVKMAGVPFPSVSLPAASASKIAMSLSGCLATALSDGLSIRTGISLAANAGLKSVSLWIDPWQIGGILAIEQVYEAHQVGDQLYIDSEIS